MNLKVPGTLAIFLLSVYPTVSRAENSFTEPTIGMEFALIKGGCFEMGDLVGDGDINERPVHEACVSDFYLGKYEVTNAQFKKFSPDHNSNTRKASQLDSDQQPVVNVSWEEAADYAEWLSGKTGATYRLPTEAEWEYAARAGSRQNHFWGNSPDEACQYANVADITAKKKRANWTTFFCEDRFLTSAPVGSFMPNGNGLFDMLGNVWEWCEDTYNSEAYSKLPKNNPIYEGSGEYKVMRGGGWSNGPLGIRSSHRVGLSPDVNHYSLGFRLVKTAK